MDGDSRTERFFGPEIIPRGPPCEMFTKSRPENAKGKWAELVRSRSGGTGEKQFNKLKVKTMERLGRKTEVLRSHRERVEK